MKFSCSFENIKQYPFGKTKCSMNFYINGVSNNLTDFTCDLHPPGPTTVGQYFVESWNLTSEVKNEDKVIKVTMTLSREFYSIFMVTYLPTILINIINQATNFITIKDRYEVIFTMNITCMMVLASVYLSVSSSLPSTPVIKPIEAWLLYNLSYPFFVIVNNVGLQVKSDFREFFSF